MTLFEPPEPAPAGDPRRWCGSGSRSPTTAGGFHGFAAAAGREDGGGALAKSLERVLRHPVDAHVRRAHRRGRARPRPGRDVRRRPPRASTLPPCSARSTSCAGRTLRSPRRASSATDFDARHSALARLYRYTVLNRPVPDPFLARRRGTSSQPLDLDGTAPRVRPAHRRATTSRRSAGARSSRTTTSRRRWCATSRRPLGGRRRRRAAVLDRGRRRSATRWCGASSGRWSTWAPAAGTPATCWPSCGPRTDRPQPRSPRPTACASGRSVTPDRGTVASPLGVGK